MAVWSIVAEISHGKGVNINKMCNSAGVSASVGYSKCNRISKHSCKGV